MHRTIEPAIHYWGTSVVLVSTRNPDGTTNVAPMSSAWWLGWSCMLGLDASSRTVENALRDRELVLNLAGVENAAAVNRLARTTGTRAVPLHKRALGYTHVEDKLSHAGLTAIPSVAVAPPRIAECPVQLEATVSAVHRFGASDSRLSIAACAIEARIVATHVDERLLAPEPDRVDAAAWNPLLMSFRRLFARGDEVAPSRLAAGEESLYAPWKRRGLAGLAIQAMSTLSEYRHRVRAESAEEP